ncbi:MAG: malonyl-CoA decarboxylase [Alphaproteobacteria bacterium]|nr:malonyl-CoA decarboxylase [Alphaproteobacteria bacterium]
MSASGLFNGFLQRITDVGRSLLEPSLDGGIIAECHALLSEKGEARGVARARDFLDRYAKLTEEEKCKFFIAVLEELGPDREALDKAIAAYLDGCGETEARALAYAAESRSQELMRRLNRAPAGTRDLVAMRRDLLRALQDEPRLAALDTDFSHLFASWFNRGFLELRRIDWSTPADILEKIILHEAVHAIQDWDDLRRRVGAPDRRLYAFFHPALPRDPLIFVDVALTVETPGEIAPVLARDREPIAAEAVRTAVFYSISNCEDGLRGVSFGNFLIKQVVEELQREFESLRTFVTLSPAPGFRRWARAELADGTGGLSDGQRDLLEDLETAAGAELATLLEARAASLAAVAARYLVEAKNGKGAPVDPVARFHLGNGARLENVHPGGDMSERGLEGSYGVMVNYLYDLKQIEERHEAFAQSGEVSHSPAVGKLLRAR